MKYLLGLFTLALMAGCQQRDAKKTSVDLSKVSADTVNYTTIQWIDSVQRIGNLKFGEEAHIDFRFKNTGDKPLFIISASPGCGCTLADYPKEAIAPGKEGEIKTVFDTKKSHGGTFTKYVNVVTNTSVKTAHTLIFSGEIIGEPKDSTSAQ
jgi:hypothetical protein